MSGENLPSPSRWRRLAVAVLVGFAAVGGPAYAFFGWRESFLHVPQVSFEPQPWRDWRRDGGHGPSVRQAMLADLVGNVLPGLDRGGIERRLGRSRTHAEMRRYRREDLDARRVDDTGAYLRRGGGHYFDEHEWDLIYPIGRERVFVFDHNGQELSPDEEYLMIRLDDAGRFESWYVEGSDRWPTVAGRDAAKRFRATR